MGTAQVTQEEKVEPLPSVCIGDESAVLSDTAFLGRVLSKCLVSFKSCQIFFLLTLFKVIVHQFKVIVASWPETSRPRLNTGGSTKKNIKRPILLFSVVTLAQASTLRLMSPAIPTRLHHMFCPF